MNDIFKLIKERRSHRQFLKKEVTKETIIELLNIVQYAPTNSNDQDTEIIVIKNQDVIKRVSDITIDYYEMKASDEKSHLNIAPTKWAHYSERLSRLRNKGVDPVFYRAPVVLVFHSIKEKIMKKDNCVIAATIVMLAARAMGLETTYMGLFELAAGDSKLIELELNIPETNQIYSSLILGYSDNKFDDLTRKPVKIEWFD